METTAAASGSNFMFIYLLRGDNYPMLVGWAADHILHLALEKAMLASSGGALRGLHLLNKMQKAEKRPALMIPSAIKS